MLYVVDVILIHTSVKLVTVQNRDTFNCCYILIHTSVKLVTAALPEEWTPGQDFNPHEREARDQHRHLPLNRSQHFNPHEREARDPPNARDPLELGNFNPHEREARDAYSQKFADAKLILIHTSAKLVTNSATKASPKNSSF